MINYVQTGNKPPFQTFTSGASFFHSPIPSTSCCCIPQHTVTPSRPHTQASLTSSLFWHLLNSRRPHLHLGLLTPLHNLPHNLPHPSPPALSSPAESTPCSTASLHHARRSPAQSSGRTLLIRVLFFVYRAFLAAGAFALFFAFCFARLP